MTKSEREERVEKSPLTPQEIAADQLAQVIMDNALSHTWGNATLIEALAVLQTAEGLKMTSEVIQTYVHEDGSHDSRIAGIDVDALMDIEVKEVEAALIVQINRYMSGSFEDRLAYRLALPAA